ncbi:MAG TPA: hypothetical protein VKA05_08280 [Acidimicrobiales bacterium]|nr:hypothetical protein [Acidimicrobiales bacterium]
MAIRAALFDAGRVDADLTSRVGAAAVTNTRATLGALVALGHAHGIDSEDDA